MAHPVLQLVDDAPLRHLVLAPPRVEGGPRLPVLCFLHGHGEAAPSDIEASLTRHGPLRRESLPRVDDRFVVVAPQLPEAGDVWHDYAREVRDVVRHVRAEHGGDPLRTYLTGFSFGGNGVFDLAIAQPDFWAALWAVDPTRLPRADPRRPVWLSVGEVARHAARLFADALGLVDADQAMGDRVMLDEGEDHVGSATAAYQDERIYAWLLSKRLGAGAQGTLPPEST